MNKDDIELPPLHYDELPETDDPIPAMHNYARKAVKADRQRLGVPAKTLNDDNSLTIAYMCGYRDGKRSAIPEGWQLVPKLPDWDMEMAGIKKLIQCTDGELECIDVDSLAVYINEVNEIFCAMLKAAPKFGEEQ